MTRADLKAAVSRPVWAALLLLGLYLALSGLNDPRGYLGTDTGSKIVTLRAMEANGGLDPDIGYWAEDLDPEGTLHPLYYTEHLGDRWVNTTTLTMLLAALPLWMLGGYQAALLLPMLGSVACALAARSIARRVAGPHAGIATFWLVGTATPVLVYALDLWEHSIGLALMLWGTDRAVAFRHEHRSPWWGLAAGALFGLAATMRTEALLYGAVAVGVVATVELGVGRSWDSVRRSLAFGGLAVVGLAPWWLLNDVLEDRLIGSAVRSSRSSGLASVAGDFASSRADEALTTSISLPGFDGRAGALVGLIAVVLIAFAARTARRLPDDAGVVVAALGGAAGIYALSLSQGLGFIPGLLTASPLAVVGVAIGWRGRSRLLAAMAVVAVPLVWATAYLGGAAPQWGARYALTSGALLAVTGSVAVLTLPMSIKRAVVALSVGVTLVGASWLSVRSHGVADLLDQIDEAASDAVVVSRVAHLFRETAAGYTDQRRWLTAVSDDAERQAVAVARRLDAPTVVVIELDGSAAENAARDARRVAEGLEPPDSEVVTALAGVPFRFSTYAVAG